MWWHGVNVDLLHNNEGFTHIEESASVLQYELTGVGFVLTVIYVNVEFISLEEKQVGDKIDS